MTTQQQILGTVSLNATAVKTALGLNNIEGGNNLGYHVANSEQFGNGANTAAVAHLQSLCDEAAIKGGIVFCPPGVYLFNNELQTAHNVIVLGTHPSSVIFKAAPGYTGRMVSKDDNIPLTGRANMQTIHNIGFDGSGTASVGYYMGYYYIFSLSNLYFKNFPANGAAIHFYGSLMGKVRDVYIDDVGTGFKIEKGINPVGMGANMLTFDNCHVHRASAWGMDWFGGGSNMVLDGCNFEGCGQSGNYNTGGVRAIDMSAGGNDVGLQLIGSTWLEANHGTNVLLRGQSINKFHGTVIAYNQDAARGVDVGVGVKLSLEAVNIAGHDSTGKDFVIAGEVTYHPNCILGNQYSIVGGGTLHKLDTTNVTPGGSNAAPTANAGSDQNLANGTATANLSGSGNDSDGSIASYAWSQQSGPNTAGISSPNSASTGLTGLTTGTYVFRLTVTDNGGLTSWDEVSITIAAPSGGGGTGEANITSWPSVFNTSVVGNTLTSTAQNNPDGDNTSYGMSDKYLPADQDGWVQFEVELVTSHDGYPGTGLIALDGGNDGATLGYLDHFIGVWENLYSGNDQSGNTAGPTPSNTWLIRVRIANGTAYEEYSSNGGSSWTTITSAPRAAGVLYLKFQIWYSGWKLKNVKGFNLV